MSGRWVVLLVGLLSVFGVYFFTKGFLLNRASLEDTSSCSAVPVAGEHLPLPPSCWTEPTFRKVILILIDALRFDFVLPSPSNSPEKYWKNKLPVFQEVLRESPKNAMLFKFMADPPTTTMQRVKGFTTGGMPTFMDVSQNFDPSQVILEDNLLLQLKRNGRKVVFMGDDIWTQLFPSDSFESVHAFPSFVVKDLHTVDNGVVRHLFPLIEDSSSSWSVLIGHFLGVDHVGHTFGPDHPEMTEKMNQMNGIIRDIISNVTMNHPDSLVMIFGDHGMTADGNHGGASFDELCSALFVYSPREIFHGVEPNRELREENIRAVDQIGLVPTLSLLLGIPIPFGNLGIVIPEFYIGMSMTQLEQMIDSKEVPDDEFLLANLERLNGLLALNCGQISRYITKYSQVTSQFPTETLERIQQSIDHIASLIQIYQDTKAVDSTQQRIMKQYEIYQNYFKYHKEVMDMCQELWTTFDLWSMLKGGIIIALTLIYIILQINKQETNGFQAISLRKGVVLGVGGIISFFLLDLADFIFVVCLFSLLHQIHQNFMVDWKINFLGGCVVVIVIVRFVTLLSNSYIEYESHIISFSLVSLVLVYTLHHFRRILDNQFWIKIALLLFTIKLSQYATAGKHETWEDKDKIEYIQETLLPFVLVIAIIYAELISQNRDHKYTAYFIYTITTVGLCGIIGAILLMITPLISFIIRVIIPLSSILLFMIYWKFKQQNCHKNFITNIFSFHRNEFNMSLHMHLSIILVGVYWIATRYGIQSPTTISWIFRVIVPNIIYILSAIQLIRIFAFKKEKIMYKNCLDGLIVMVPIFLLLLGYRSSYPIFLMNASLFLVLELHERNPNQLLTVTFIYLLSIKYFYCTGHFPQFTSIQFQSGFIGTDTYNIYIGGLLVFINTFSSLIYFSMALPLVDPKPPHTQKTFLYFMMWFEIASLAIITLNSLERRNLFVFRIFAPKYVFDVVMMMAAHGIILLQRTLLY